MVKGLVNKIQTYSTKDGPGLRTTVFMMGCNLRCLWCANPENLEHRKRVFYFKERCQHCGLCVHFAKNNAIKFAEVGCTIDRDACDNLLDMVDICPYDAYECIGKEYTVDELVKKLIRDKEFYDASLGGVTFSGGEAALQKDFIIEVSKRLREHGIHVCLDTAGCYDKEVMQELLENVDLVLYDVKAFDEAMHIRCTGVSNHRILDNLRVLAQAKTPVIVRLVIVPTYNDDEEDIYRRIDYLVEMKANLLQVDILKYHIFGVGKYDKLDMEYPIAEKLEVDDALIERVYNYGLSKGLHMTIGG